MSVRFSIRLFAATLLGSTAWVAIDAFPGHSDHLDVIVAIVLFVLGMVAVTAVVMPPLERLSAAVLRAPVDQVFDVAAGLALGLLAAALLDLPLSHLPYPSGMWLPLIAVLAVTPLCVEFTLIRGKELRALLHVGGARSEEEQREKPSVAPNTRVLLDTSAIIDGRIADITGTGFIHGELIVPHFVLDELQHIADSPDVLRRNRGRRGLDMLNRMSKDGDAQVVVLDIDTDEAAEVDGKLVHIARRLGCPIITNDFNLNRVAELQGVRVLNINQLANAVKPVVLPGEEMAVHIIQQGKEFNQGVGYLDDGTMIVVEDGQRYINHDVDIIVTRVLQTVAGRMIFAHPKVQGNGR